MENEKDERREIIVQGNPQEFIIKNNGVDVVSYDKIYEATNNEDESLLVGLFMIV